MPRPPPGFEWDERKAAYNFRKHGVSFAAVDDFDFDAALELEGLNDEHDEIRTTLLSRIRKNVHVLVFTRRQEKIRVISLRKATAWERRVYIATKGY